ncbi:hypothetical protein WEI85_08315 [Actinomycetes bacterium KLBMP 9797]
MVQGEGRRRWVPWLVGGLILALAVCAVPVVVAVTMVDRVPRVAASGGVPAASPRPGDPESVTQAWLRDRMTDVLAQQAAALLRGDERGFLAAAVPTSRAVPVLRRQYRSLRALRVTVWQPRIVDLPARQGGEWEVAVSFGHCFAVPGCQPARVSIETRWTGEADRLRLVAVEPSPSAQDGPRPWEVSDLVVASGRRTLVATTSAQRGQLATLLAEAEQAAAVADRYAVGAPPDRYLIFFAGAAEWRRWYGGDRPEWTAGYAVPVGGDHFDVVLGAQGLHPSVRDDLLRHEMTHVSSLPGEGYRTGANWWLVEGLADHAAADGRPVHGYESLPDVRKLVSAGWQGPLAEAEPGSGATGWRVNAAYGVGYLAVRHLVDRYGLSDVLAFFQAVMRDRRSVEEASRRVFGMEWPALHADCVAYIVAAAGP